MYPFIDAPMSWLASFSFFVARSCSGYAKVSVVTDIAVSAMYAHTRDGPFQAWARHRCLQLVRSILFARVPCASDMPVPTSILVATAPTVRQLAETNTVTNLPEARNGPHFHCGSRSHLSMHAMSSPIKAVEDDCLRMRCSHPIGCARLRMYHWLSSPEIGVADGLCTKLCFTKFQQWCST